MRYIVKTRDKDSQMDALARQIAREGMPDNAEIIYDERNRLFRVYLNGIPYIVKAFRRPNAINAVAYVTVRKSKARRSFENALKLESLGIATPRPEAYMEVRSGLRLHESYYICRDVASPQIRFWEKRKDAPSLIPAFAADMLRLHRLGVWHKDFSPGNILVGGNADIGYTFYYIDLNRMQFGVHKPASLLRMFGRLHDDEKSVAALARAYADKLRSDIAAGRQIPEGINPDAVESIARLEYRKFWAKQARKQALKKKFKKEK
ncbi:MAG: lipopolysaccharide kinase InaA family protein [Prevotella sp.]|nr:lipopolysaccharide kinase InaA family protein [Prevotella sp.]MCM1074878.1 lipopolysaccharide kinase InaA family protein [Ruminococcus sp.]